MDRKIFKLNDSVLAQIVRVVQLGYLTGTDVTDYMRQFRLEESVPGELVLTPEYITHDKEVIDQLFDDLDTMLSQDKGEQN